VLVLGSQQVGKSRALAIMTGSPESTGYVPTAGTNSTRFELSGTEVNLIEVGGGLRPFWSRALNDRIDAVWYMLTPEELQSKNFASLVEFLKESSEKLLKASLCISINGALSMSEESAHKTITESILNAGVFDSPIISVIPDVSRKSYEKLIADILFKLSSSNK
jgi:hypothetical protein